MADGNAATLVDLSTIGAHVVSQTILKPNQRVRMVLSDEHGAVRFNAVVALKGCGTVIAHPDSRWRINTSGNPGLASGGSGDVLSGMAGALLAQGWPAAAALCGAVHLHGAAADALADAGDGPIGIAAGELIPVARTLLNRLIATNA